MPVVLGDIVPSLFYVFPPLIYEAKFIFGSLIASLN